MLSKFRSLSLSGLALSSLALLIGVFVVFTAGCSDSSIERVQISGQVLLDGQPLTRGTIRVEPSGARLAAGRIDEQGRFELMTFEPGDGVPKGQHPVAINAGEQLGVDTVRWHAPPKYASSDKSGIILNVTGSQDDVVIELTWDGGKPFVQKFGPGVE